MIKDIAKILGVDNFKHTENENSITYTLDTDNNFGSVYTILESNDSFESVDDNYMLNSTVANLEYVYNNEYDVELKGNFDSDTYSVVITEKQ